MSGFEQTEMDLRAEIAELENAIKWVINDAMYKAPEQTAEVAASWILRLQAALDRASAN